MRIYAEFRSKCIAGKEMALQSALSRLRKPAADQIVSSAEKRVDTGSRDCTIGCQRRADAPSNSVFSLEEDLFNFSDDELIQFETTSVEPDSGKKDNADSSSRLGRMETSSDAEIFAMNSGTHTSKNRANGPPAEPKTSSPSSAALERLKSFKFVKTPSVKGGRKPEIDSTALPPAKRRTVCDDVTNISGKDSQDTIQNTLLSSPHEANFNKVDAGFGSSASIQPSTLQAPNGCSVLDLASEVRLDLDFDSFLSDFGEDDSNGSVVSSQASESGALRESVTCSGSRVVLLRENPSPSPSPFKQPTHIPRKGPIESFSRTPNAHSINKSQRSDALTSAERNPFAAGREPPTTPLSHSSTGGHNFRASQSNTEALRLHTPQRYSLTSANSSTFATPKSRPRRTPSSFPSPQLHTPQRDNSTTTHSDNDTFTTPKSRPPTAALRTPASISAAFAQAARRKFPGPAGLLPALSLGQSLDGISIPAPSTPTPASTPRVQRLTASSSSALRPTAGEEGGGEPEEEFTQGPWVNMMEDLDMSDSYSSALLQYNISRAIKQASRQRLQNGKVTHLRVMLKSIVPAGKNASAVLRDPTGEILCTLHTKVLEEFQKDLQPGAVLVLRQVSVFSPSARKHYLNITPNNIVRVYSTHSDGSSSTPLLLSEVEKEYSQSDQDGYPTSQDDRFSQSSSTRIPGTSQHQVAANVNLGHLSLSVQPRNSRPSDTLLVSTGLRNQSNSTSAAGSLFQRNSEPTDRLNRDGFSFEDFPDTDMQTDYHSSNSKQVSHSLFSDHLAEDEFDSLFSDISDKSLGF